MIFESNASFGNLVFTKEGLFKVDKFARLEFIIKNIIVVVRLTDITNNDEIEIGDVERIKVVGTFKRTPNAPFVIKVGLLCGKLHIGALYGRNLQAKNINI